MNSKYCIYLVSGNEVNFDTRDETFDLKEKFWRVAKNRQPVLEVQTPDRVMVFRTEAIEYLEVVRSADVSHNGTAQEREGDDH